MADVEIFHPLLGRTVKVPERTVRIWKRSGWVEASTRLAQTAPTAGRAAIAPPSADEPTPTPGATTTPHEED